MELRNRLRGGSPKEGLLHVPTAARGGGGGGRRLARGMTLEVENSPEALLSCSAAGSEEKKTAAREKRVAISLNFFEDGECERAINYQVRQLEFSRGGTSELRRDTFTLRQRSLVTPRENIERGKNHG